MVGTLIDHFCPEKVTSSYILLSDISDNFPLNIKLKNFNLVINNQDIEKKYIKDFSRINTNKLLTDAIQVFNKHETDKIIKSKNSKSA